MEMSLLFKINSLEQAQVEGVLASSVEVMANFEAWKGGSGIDRKGSVARDIHRPHASNHNFVGSCSSSLTGFGAYRCISKTCRAPKQFSSECCILQFGIIVVFVLLLGRQKIV